MAELKPRPATAGASKFSSKYWEPRLFRMRWTDGDGLRQLAQEWCCRIQAAGDRREVPLGSNTKNEAARKAALLYQRVRTVGWEEALREFAPDRANRRGVPTIGEFIAAVEDAADVSPRTLRGYTVAMRWIAGHAFGVQSAGKQKYDAKAGGNVRWRSRIDRIHLSRLTPDRVQAALHRFIRQSKGNPLLEKRARRSAASMLRQAKSLFSSKWKLPFTQLPNPFEGVRVEHARPDRYHSTVDAATLLQSGREEMATADPDAYVALLLALGAGLRRSEIDGLTWSQIDAATCTIRIATTDTFAPKTDGSEGQVFVDPGLIAELERFRGRNPTLFVLAGRPPRTDSAVPYYRAESTFERLNQWLRRNGVLASKPIHALRKEFGSIVAASSDIHVASRQLRHGSIGVTAMYYADHRRRVAPPVGDLLGLTAKA